MSDRAKRIILALCSFAAFACIVASYGNVQPPGYVNLILTILFTVGLSSTFYAIVPPEKIDTHFHRTMERLSDDLSLAELR